MRTASYRPWPVDPAGGVENANRRVSHTALDGANYRAAHRLHRPCGGSPQPDFDRSALRSARTMDAG